MYVPGMIIEYSITDGTIIAQQLVNTQSAGIVIYSGFVSVDRVLLNDGRQVKLPQEKIKKTE